MVAEHRVVMCLDGYLDGILEHREDVVIAHDLARARWSGKVMGGG